MNKFKSKIFNMLRQRAIKIVTNNFGNIVETKDNIFCYVTKRAFKKDGYENRIYCNIMNERKKELCKLYNINKKIVYIFEDLKFDKKVYIYGYDNCEIIINNCDFDFNLKMYINGKCTLKNSRINTFGYFSIGAKDLILENLDIDNYFKISDEILSVIISGDNNLSIINSKIGKINDKTNVTLLSDKLTLNDSKIAGNKVKLETQSIFMNLDSLINGRTINIKSPKYNQLNLMSSEIEINSERIVSFDNLIYVRKPEDSLELKRLHLINTLKLIKEKCEKENEDKFNQIKNNLDKKYNSIKENLDNRPITKILK